MKIRGKCGFSIMMRAQLGWAIRHADDHHDYHQQQRFTWLAARQSGGQLAATMMPVTTMTGA
jgi:hypothetical protein